VAPRQVTALRGEPRQKVLLYGVQVGIMAISHISHQ
jgi:hypothetical protein